MVTGAGANGGIGCAFALGQARYGAKLFIADIDALGVQAMAAEI